MPEAGGAVTARKKIDKNREVTMTTMHASRVRGRGDFRIESDGGLQSPHWTCTSAHSISVHERSLAVAMAAKSRSKTSGGEIRVVYAPTGEVIFRKSN